MDDSNPQELVETTAVITASHIHEIFHEIIDLFLSTDLGSEESALIREEVPRYGDRSPPQ